MNNKNAHNKAIIWTTASMLLWFWVAIAAKVLQFFMQESSGLSGLIYSPLGIVGSIVIIAAIITPMLLISCHYAKLAKMQKLATVLRILILFCAIVSLVFAGSLLSFI